MKEKKIVLILGFLTLSFLLFFSLQTKQTFRTILIGEKVLTIETARSESERILGLSGREGLPADHGLLFVFEKDGVHGIWMKDMKFPIDIMWIDKNFNIIHLESAVSPQTYPEIFYPESPARYVLETSSGFVSENRIHVGDRVEFSK